MKGKNTMNRKTYSEKESAGLDTGLSSRSDFMSDDLLTDASFSDASSGSQGYSRQAKGQEASKSVSEKGQSLTIRGCK
jgi:hypothetical protein